MLLRRTLENFWKFAINSKLNGCGFVPHMLLLSLSMGGKAAKMRLLNSKSKLPSSGDETLNSDVAHRAAINCMSLSSDKKHLITGSDDCIAMVWNIATEAARDCIAVLKGHTMYVTAVALDGPYAMTGSADRSVKKWDTSSATCLQTFNGHDAAITRLLSTGELLVSASYDATLRCWLLQQPDTSNNKINNSDNCRHFLVGHRASISSIAHVARINDEDETDQELTSNILVSGSHDGRAKSWSLESGRCLRNFVGHSGAIICLTVAENGTTLFTGSADATIRTWDMVTAEPLNVFEGHRGSVLSVQVSEKLLFSASADWTAKAWIAELGDCSRTFQGATHSLSFALCYKGLLVTAGGDKVIRVYVYRTGVLKRVFSGHKAAITSIVAIEERLFTASNDGTMREWSLIGLTETTSSTNQSH